MISFMKESLSWLSCFTFCQGLFFHVRSQQGQVKHRSKHQRNNGTQLDENIKWRSTGVFQRISNCITNNSSSMFISLLSGFFDTFKWNIDKFIISDWYLDGFINSDLKLSSLNHLLRVIPSTSSITCRNSHLYSRNRSSW